MVPQQSILTIGPGPPTLRLPMRWLDLYHSPDVISSGVLKFGTVELKDGTHHLTTRITGANPAAVPK